MTYSDLETDICNVIYIQFCACIDPTRRDSARFDFVKTYIFTLVDSGFSLEMWRFRQIV